ncbi:MAG: mechanosensitive ion channel family protein [Gemmatimonadota bacterium]
MHTHRTQDAAASQTTGERLDEVSGRLEGQIDGFVELLPLLGIAVAIVVVFALLAWAVGRARTSRLFPKLNSFLGAMLLRFAQFTLVTLGLVIALDLLDATALVGAVVGTAGLAGLAIGFAFKDIAENYLAGIILSLRQPFAKNDLIVVGGHEGKVVRLTGRETMLMTPDGNHVQIPNALVVREPMVNYTRNPRRRFTVDVDVAADTDLSDALDVGLEVLRDMKGVIDDPAPSGLIVGFGSGTMALRFFGWVNQREADFGRVHSEAMRLLKEGLEGSGVELPSPEYRVSLDRPLPTATEDRPLRRASSRPSAQAVDGGQRDVAVDRALDEQIEEERQRADEEDLLE